MELMEWVFLTIILVMIGKALASYAEIGKVKKLFLTAVFLYTYFEEGLHIQTDTLVINEFFCMY